MENQWKSMQNQWQIIENQCKINETSMKMKWKSLQLNAAQHTCRDREPWRDRSASEASPFSFKDFVAVSSCNLLGGVRNVMLGACVQCWSLLRSVTKLIKFKARFPFFVRQVSKKWVKRLHICQKPEEVGASFWPTTTTHYPLPKYRHRC